MIRRIPSVRRELEVVSTSELSPSVRRLVLRTRDGSAVDYLAGQWMKLYLPGGIDRDYSIASAPVPEGEQGSDRFELAVTRVEGGAGSAALFGLAPGARLEALGPNGLFVREDRHRDLPAIYVGTGTGVAPLRAMLQEELGRSEPTPQVLLFGCRTEGDLLYREELEALAAAHPRFRYVPTLSRGGQTWRGRRGYVQHHLAELHAELGPAHHYVCGLTKMIDDVRRTLKQELGLDRRLVHTERFD